MKTQAHPGAATRTLTYDAAGNVTTDATSRGYSLKTTYDVLNRAIKRLLPQVTYAQTCELYVYGSCSLHMPTKGSTDLCLAADTVTFGYDAGGNLIRADNTYSRIRRAYFPGGALQTDAQYTGTYYNNKFGSCGPNSGTDPDAGGERSFGPHTYGLRYAYDVGGRRDSLFYPGAIGSTPVGACSTASNCVQKYWYNATSGGLDSTNDLSGNKIKFTFNAMDRLLSVAYPGSVTDSYSYDADGRMLSRSGDHAASYSRDALGRIVHTSSTPYDSDVWYNGTGAVMTASNTTAADGGNTFMRYDAIGNKLKQWQEGLAAPDVVVKNYTYDTYGRLTQAADSQTAYHKSTRDYEYDAAGNVSREYEFDNGLALPATLYDFTRHAYGPDEKLRVVDHFVGAFEPNGDAGTPGRRSTFEEYWYDALGRRILTRSRHAASCPGTAGECQPTITRSVWDGDQLVVEFRSNGSDTAKYYTLENDANTAGTSAKGDPYGNVVDVHAGGIDQPVALLRYYLGYPQPSIVTVYPHQNWRGETSWGSFVDGTKTTTCTGGTSGCPIIAWTGNNMTVSGSLANPTSPESWMGTLIGGTDASGLKYQRNRYYDPNSGRFTQQDPIGLGGGMNLYGFAGSDQVNNSDPFGLCPPGRSPMESLQEAVQEFQGAIASAPSQLQEFATSETGGQFALKLAAIPLSAATMGAAAELPAAATALVSVAVRAQIAAANNPVTSFAVGFGLGASGVPVPVGINRAMSAGAKAGELAKAVYGVVKMAIALH